MRSLHRVTTVAAILFLNSSALLAQELTCPGLPTPEAPKLEECKGGWREALKGVVGAGCAAENDRRKAGYERMMRGFATGLEYRSGGGFFLNRLEKESREVTVDSLRGCRGENVNIEITPGTLTSFEYELVSPSAKVIASNQYSMLRGDAVLGENVTLTETGYYTLKTRTTAPVQFREYKNKDGSIEREAYYPRSFKVSFRSDASVAALGAGDKVDATVTEKQPFFRKVLVKGGSKVRFRFASQGTGDFIVIVRRESGEELYRSPAPGGFYETRAFTPRTDETFRVEVRPATVSQAIGLQLSVLDDKSTREAVTSSSRIAGTFKLPAHFDGTKEPSISTSETVRFTYQASGAEALALTVKPSQLAGLSVKVRAYNEESEEVTLKSAAIASASTLSLPITGAGAWVIEVTPLAATDLAEAGEAKYQLEFAPAAPAAPAARHGRKGTN